MDRLPLYLLCCALLLCSCSTLPVESRSNLTDPPPFTPIDLNLYHSSVRLMQEIKELVRRHPDKLSMDSIKGGNRGYQSEVSVVTYCNNRRESYNDSKFRILLSFGQHGRELITSELALRILSIMTEEKFLPKLDSVSLNSFLDKLIIKVVPMENLNGRKIVEGGDLCERRNGRGVDLNRNWSVDWGKKEKDFDPYEENPGTGPFSEPEAQIMQKLASSFRPHIWVNVHSGMQALFMPYDHKNTTPRGFSYEQMRLLLENLNRRHCQNKCMIGSGGGSVGYLAHGTATDYMYDVVKVPMAFTFEIYGDSTATSKDCFKMFNPTDFGTFNRVLTDWSSAFFTIFKLGPRHLRELSDKGIGLTSWESIDEYLDGYLMDRRNRISKGKWSRPVVPSLPL
ncbi:hypothetical protein MLD38_015236 [Melastoma candidum]|uniref:Uncharacterized protein n=1 Tax=Melastoma candidum TaxID=119954 RepID=A0ACB9RF96_9MYRT|nr:hypothetical protein MLD38_015236 [Melastoma candidum]